MSEPQSPIAFDPDVQPDNWKYQPRACAQHPELAAVAEQVLRTIQDSGLTVAQALQVVQELPRLITSHARLNLAAHSATEPGR